MNTSINKLALAVALGSFITSGSTYLHAATKSSRIIGGIEAPANTYSWVVSLQSKHGEHFCGASLVAPEWIMTAAHCIEDEDRESIQAVIAEHDTSVSETGEAIRQIKRIISHPDYDEDNDIALLQLEQPVEIPRVNMADQDLLNSLSSKTTLKTMGWGNRDTEGEDFPNTLHEVGVALVSKESCSKAYENVGTEISDKMICAGVPEGGKDSCQGDSGGPLVLQTDNEWVQLGIVSFGEGCGLKGYPGVYTSIAAYKDWIAEVQSSSPEDDSHDPDTDNEEEWLDLDLTQPFDLPPYILVEAQEGEIPDLISIALRNTLQEPLQINAINIAPLDYDDFDDEDFDEEDEEEFENEDKERNTEADNDESEHTRFSVAEENCSHTSLEAGQSCEIKLSLNSFAEEFEQPIRGLNRHFPDELSDEAYGNGDYNEWEEEFNYENHDEDEFEEIDEVLSIETGDSDHPIVEIPLIGIIDLPEPKVDSPEYLEFNATNQNQEVSEAIELVNHSSSDLSITHATIVGSNAFSIEANDCTASVIEADEYCSLTLQFTPGEEAEVHADLIVSYDNGETLEIPLYGLVYTLIEMEEQDESNENQEIADMLDWYFNGETPWGMNNADAFELITDSLAENEESLLMTEIEGPASLDFDFSLEGDHENNELSFVVDGKVVKTINSSSKENQHSTELSKGKHTVQWVYKKKSQNSEAKATVSNIRVNAKSSSTQTSSDSSGGSFGWASLSLLAALLGFRRLRK